MHFLRLKRVCDGSSFSVLLNEAIPDLILSESGPNDRLPILIRIDNALLGMNTCNIHNIAVVYNVMGTLQV
jgi:hypothetical protein